MRLLKSFRSYALHLIVSLGFAAIINYFGLEDKTLVRVAIFMFIIMYTILLVLYDILENYQESDFYVIVKSFYGVSFLVMIIPFYEEIFSADISVYFILIGIVSLALGMYELVLYQKDSKQLKKKKKTVNYYKELSTVKNIDRELASNRNESVSDLNRKSSLLVKLVQETKEEDYMSIFIRDEYMKKQIFISRITSLFQQINSTVEVLKKNDLMDQDLIKNYNMVKLLANQEIQQFNQLYLKYIEEMSQEHEEQVNNLIEKVI